MPCDGRKGPQRPISLQTYNPIASMEQIQAWKGRVETYLEVNLGDGHKFLFASGAGNEPTPPESMPLSERDRWIHVQARLMTLKRLVWMAIRNADRIRP